MYHYETCLVAGSVRVTLQYKTEKLGKHSLMYKTVLNEMRIIFCISQLTATLNICSYMCKSETIRNQLIGYLTFCISYWKFTSNELINRLAIQLKCIAL